MSSNNSPHSQPIPINTRRGRAPSVSDASSSEESSSPVSPKDSPLSSTQPRIGPLSPTNSPLLTYFLSQSPKSPGPATFPFRRGFGTAVFEDDSEPDLTTPVQKHARRASAAAWPSNDRFPPVVTPAAPQTDRAAGLLRRLSLGGAALRPPVPQPRPTASPTDSVQPNAPLAERSQPMAPRTKSRRANTLAPGSARPKRAPSPMGERILTGHFDGFN